MPNRIMHNLRKIDIEPGQSGVTVRRGSKWSDASPGELLELCVCDSSCLDEKHECAVHCHIVGQGEVEAIWTGIFEDIPARIVEDEHKKSCRTYSGLLTEMQRVYDAFEEDELVTAIIYHRLNHCCS